MSVELSDKDPDFAYFQALHEIYKAEVRDELVGIAEANRVLGREPFRMVAKTYFVPASLTLGDHLSLLSASFKDGVKNGLSHAAGVVTVAGLEGFLRAANFRGRLRR